MNSIEDQLKFIFTNINDWLKFAEAKNGILIAFNGATIFGLLQSWGSLNKAFHPLIQYWFIPFLIISSIISFSSFIPFLDIVEVLSLRTKRSNQRKAKKVEEKGEVNIYFYGNIKDLTPLDYLRNVYQSSQSNIPEKINKNELDLANQIVINSKIAWKKFNIFSVAGTLTLSAAVIPIIFIGGKFLIQFLLKK